MILVIVCCGVFRLKSYNIIQHGCKTTNYQLIDVLIQLTKFVLVDLQKNSDQRWQFKQQRKRQLLYN